MDFPHDRSLPQVGPHDRTISLNSAPSVANDAERTSLTATLQRWSAPRFRQIRSFARGGLGEVFLAEDLEFQREVALKQIQLASVNQPSVRADFSREARITGRLEHPNIAPVYSLGEFEDGRPFYVMRLIRGESLSDAIKRLHEPPAGPPSGTESASPQPQPVSSPNPPGHFASTNHSLRQRQLLSGFVQVCNAVAYAHDKGIIHRDIKPANIMLGEFGETLLVDWGIARQVGQPESHTNTAGAAASATSSATQQGQVKGTPAYMSPEQARGDVDQLGPATDIYSLGATLYTLLTGQLPVDGKTVNEVLTNVKQGLVTPPRARTPKLNISRPLEAICLTAMSLDPQARYASAKELAADIERYLADEPVAAWKEPLGHQARRWLKRHPAVVSASAAALLLAAVAGILMAQQQYSHAAAMGQKNQEVQGQRDKAEAREQMAIEAISRFGEIVSTNEALKNNPALRALRHALLEEPLGFFQLLKTDLEADTSTNTNSRHRLADAAFGLALITHEIGDQQKAIIAYEEAQEGYNQLAVEFPEQAEYQAKLATTYNNLAALFSDSGRRSEALATNQAALKLREKLAQDFPARKEFLFDLGSTHNNLGIIYCTADQTEDALAAFQRALSTREQLVRDHPDEPSFQSGLATCHNNLATVFAQRGQTEKAIASYKQALAIRKQLTRDHPANTAFQCDTAACLDNLGSLLVQSGQPEEALAHHQEAQACFEKLVRDHGSVTEFQRGLARSQIHVGSLLIQGGQLDQADPPFTAAAQILEALLKENPQAAELRSTLGVAHNCLGLIAIRQKNWNIARDHLATAADHQEQAFNADPANADFRRHLENHYINLLLVARQLNDAALTLQTQIKLAALRASEPAL